MRSAHDSSCIASHQGHVFGHSSLRVGSKVPPTYWLSIPVHNGNASNQGERWAVLCRLTADLERVRADSKTAESRLQQELHRAEGRARLAQADAERQKAALDKERRYSSTKDQVHILPKTDPLRPTLGLDIWHAPKQSSG